MNVSYMFCVRFVYVSCTQAAVLRRMAHTPQLAMAAQTAAEAVLGGHPPQPLALALLQALTRLACRSLVTLPRQVGRQDTLPRTRPYKASLWRDPK